MTDKLVKKVKRPRMDWYRLLMESFDDAAKRDFYILMAKHPKMSFNRLAYNALKRHYSTTTLESCRWLGKSLADFYE